MRLFKHFTDVTQGVRRLGAAAVDLCHVALGIVEAYWEYRLKPWDVAAGVCSSLWCSCRLHRCNLMPLSLN
jgi:myo-inositol-1(or 4)-monophosphatase